MIDLKEKLPFWLKGSQAVKFADAAKAFFTRWETWLNEAVAQADISNCSTAALAEHAKDRTIDRLPGELESVWRTRVKSAFTSASQAGSRRGFEQILAAHNVQNFSVEERVAGLDWDIILVNLDPDSLSIASETLLKIFSRWGRPTRRFSIGHSIVNPVYLGSGAAEFIEHHGIAA